MCIGYMQITALFYTWVLEHLQISVFANSSGTSPLRMLMDNCKGILWKHRGGGVLSNCSMLGDSIHVRH